MPDTTTTTQQTTVQAPTTETTRKAPEQRPAGRARQHKAVKEAPDYDAGAAIVSTKGAGYTQDAARLSPRSATPKTATGDSGAYALSGSHSSWERKGLGGEMKRVSAVGLGRGTSAKDHLAPELGPDGKPTGKTVRENAVADLESVKKFGHRDKLTKTTSNEGNGAYTESISGAAAGTKVEGKLGVDGEGKLSGPSAEAFATTGVVKRAGYRQKVGKDDGPNAGFDAYAQAEMGASAGAKLDKDGFTADAAANIGAEAAVEGNADLQKAIKLKGLSKDLVFGIGVKGKVGVQANAGAGATAALTRENIGIAGNIGADATASAGGDVHVQLGPAAVAIEGEALAGAAINAKGKVFWENGKVVVTGSVAAALGYGAKVGFKAELDVMQAVELGIITAKAAHDLADMDNDGKLTLNDPATGAAKAMEGGAKAVDQGATAVLATMDADQDGKLTLDDAKRHVKKARDKAVGMGRAAKDKVVETAVAAGKATHDALDVDGDGKLGLTDAAAAKDAAVEKAGELTDAAVEKAGELTDAAVEKAGELKDAAVEKAGELKDAAVATGKKAASAAHDAADVNNDGKIDVADAVAAKDKVVKFGGAVVDKAAKTGQALATRAVAAKDAAVKKATQVKDAVAAKAHDAADINGDGVVDARDAKAAVDKTAAAVHATGKALEARGRKAVEAAHGVMDIDGDGKLSAADAKKGAKAAVQKAQAVKESVKRSALSAYESGVKRANAAWESGRKALDEAKTTVHQAADRDGDGRLGLNDVAAGASQAKKAALETAGAVKDKTVAVATAAGKKTVAVAKSAYNEAGRQLNQAGKTLSSGYDSAKKTLSGTWSKISSYF